MRRKRKKRVFNCALPFKIMIKCMQTHFPKINGEIHGKSRSVRKQTSFSEKEIPKDSRKENDFLEL